VQTAAAEDGTVLAAPCVRTVPVLTQRGEGQMVACHFPLEEAAVMAASASSQ
jgi:hypothetical protein